MAENLYDESSDAPEVPQRDTPENEDEAGESEEQTTLIPKSMLGGKTPEVGDECKFKIEHVYGDEIEISYVKAHGKSDAMEGADREMEAMANMGDEA